jgi:hypothetical protein
LTASPLTFFAGEATATIKGKLLPDLGATPTLTFTLGTPAGAALGSPTTNTLTIIQTPAITSSAAPLAATAAAVTINGSGFDPVMANNSVTFNGGAVGSVMSASSTSLTVTFSTLPATAGALTAIVTTDGQSSGSAVQVATVTPVVTAMTSNIAGDATTITIAGYGFDPVAANNTVSLNDGLTGVVTAATATSLTVTLTGAPTSVGNLNAVVTTDGQSSGSAVQVGTSVTSYVLGLASVTEGPGAGSDSVVLAVTPAGGSWTASSNASWLHLGTGGIIAADSPNPSGGASGAGSANVVFSFDANTGATRTGTLTIAGQTLTVTQAGAGYMATGLGGLTTLASQLAGQPYGVAVDSNGNVFFCQDGFGPSPAILKYDPQTNATTTIVGSINGTAVQGVAVDAAGNVYFTVLNGQLYGGQIWEWNATTQEASMLVSGLECYGLAVDPYGNIYFADHGNNAVKVWSPVTQTVRTPLTSGLSSNYGVVVDGADNVYIADSGNSNVVEVLHAYTDPTAALTGSPAILSLASNEGGALVAVNDYVIATSATPLSINVLANDAIPAGATVALSSVSGASYGRVAINGSSITYTPHATFGRDDHL